MPGAVDQHKGEVCGHRFLRFLCKWIAHAVVAVDRRTCTACPARLSTAAAGRRSGRESSCAPQWSGWVRRPMRRGFGGRWPALCRYRGGAAVVAWLTGSTAAGMAVFPSWHAWAVRPLSGTEIAWSARADCVGTSNRYGWSVRSPSSARCAWPRCTRRRRPPSAARRLPRTRRGVRRTGRCSRIGGCRALACRR